MRALTAAIVVLSLAVIGFGQTAHAQAAGAVVIESMTNGAQVYIDEKYIGTIPIGKSIPLTAGEHMIKIIKPGYSEFSSKFFLKTGQELELEADLVPVAGLVKIMGNVGAAEVIIDGKKVGSLPFDGEVTVGDHTIEVTKNGYKPFKKSMKINAGEEYKLDVELKPSGKVAFGFIAVDSATKAARVYIDDDFIGEVPLKAPAKVPTGERKVKIVKRGYTPFETKVTVAKGKTADVEVDLIAYAGIINLKGNVAKAKVLIDGKEAGKTPFDNEIPVGEHTITIKKEGYAEFTSKLIVKAGKHYNMSYALKPLTKAGPTPPVIAKTDPFYKTWWFWTIAGVVVVGGATTAGVIVATGDEGGSKIPTPNATLYLP